MIEKDTIRLLRECDAGIKMGVSSIDDVLKYAKDDNLKETLSESKDKHEELQSEVDSLLDKYHDDGKEPNIMAKSMSAIKTNAKLALSENDETVADLITDGCNMGVKSLCKYLNQYKAADERSKDIAKRLVSIEETLGHDMRPYL